MTDTDPNQMFEGLRVLDLSRWVPGEFCTKMFADFGADVIKIEKPGEGSLTRCWGPFPNDEVDIESGGLFLHLNTNKRSVTLDLRTERGRAIFLQLAQTADLVVESFRPGTLEKLHLGIDDLRQENARLNVTRISNFGQTGPYRNYEATGLVLEAMGGPMNATGEAHRAPQKKPANLAQYVVGRYAAVASLASLHWSKKTGRGTVNDVAANEVLLSGADRRASYLLTAAYSGHSAPRGLRGAHRGATSFQGPFRAKDGYVMVYITTPVFWNRLIDMIGGIEPGFRDHFRDRQGLLDESDWDRFLTGLQRWLDNHDKFWIMAEAEARHIPVTALLEINEVYESEHFRSRGAFVSADHPRAGVLEYVGAPWLMRNGWKIRSTAPLLGQHTEAVLGELGFGRSETSELRADQVV